MSKCRLGLMRGSGTAYPMLRFRWPENWDESRKLDNHEQEPWKMPLRQFIRHLYFKRFGKERPDIVQTIEEKVLRDAKKKELRREARLLRRQSDSTQREEIP
jgi:hypothetical protein